MFLSNEYIMNVFRCIRQYRKDLYAIMKVAYKKVRTSLSTLNLKLYTLNHRKAFYAIMTTACKKVRSSLSTLNLKPYTLYLLLLIGVPAIAQKKTANSLYIDKKGVWRYSKDNKEAAFFGVNYTTPFAYAYRAHKALGVDLEQAIRQDVYHLARLGFNAFRVHVWDTEISDVRGNLLDNEHLRLFDFLLAELKKRDIKIIITPIAFWGNGYPEPDEKTPGFSALYGKGKATTNDSAIAAQENYLQQFFKHVNPYTRLTYNADPDVIAVEINNEPSHGEKASVTTYINRLATAIKSTGYSKPLFYNISQNPGVADAVAASSVDGYSFQWYPVNLVAGHHWQGNFLPHVDKYNIPFADTIPAFRNKPKMVYEFDAADISSSYLYPAMARSFREAGFQWATQFAYDPLAIAYANTEYQTHYVNLAYTPAKAISLMIAGEVFRTMPMQKHYGSYPADSSFNGFRVSYRQQLSEMNTVEKFYYSGNTATKPLDVRELQHVAGVGSSPVVQYQGTGAYFLDKFNGSVWRLEVMPDAVPLSDPFETASLKKEVVRVQWQVNTMSIYLPDLGSRFAVQGINEGNSYFGEADDMEIKITPGTYLLISKPGLSREDTLMKGSIGLREFVAPQPVRNTIALSHQPVGVVSAGKEFTITAHIAGVNEEAIVNVLMARAGERWNKNGNIKMTRGNENTYTATIPVELVSPGQLQYRIVIQSNGTYYNWPGSYEGNPYAWDNYHKERWQVWVAAPQSRLELFNATSDQNIIQYPWSRAVTRNWITGDNPQELLLRLQLQQLAPGEIAAIQHIMDNLLQQRSEELVSFDTLVIRARMADFQQATVKLLLITKDGVAYSMPVPLSPELADIKLPVSKLVPDSCLLLPRPYPGFHPLWFNTNTNAKFTVADLDKIQLLVLPAKDHSLTGTLDIQAIWLQKNN